MYKHLFKLLTLLMLSIIIGYGCANSIDKGEHEILILNNIQDTVPYKFRHRIMNLPEYKIWNERKREKVWRPYFETRKLLVGNKTYYHIELIQQYYNEITSSSLPIPEVVCYFRADPTDGRINLLHMDSNKFLDLSTESARDYLKKCFARD